MADIFGAFSRGYSEGSDRRRQKQQSQIDDLVKYAQLAESGYNVKQVPGKGIFGRSQMVLEQNPNFQSLKELQRQKMVRELDPNYAAQQAAAKEKAIIEARRSFGGGASNNSEASDSNPDNQNMFIYDSQGKEHLNPLKKPLSDTGASKLSAAQQSLENIQRVRQMATPEKFGNLKSGFSKVRLGNKLGVNNPESLLGNVLNASSFGLAKLPFKTTNEQKEFENNLSTLIEGQLRARTGAAAPQAEIDREVSRILASDDTLDSFLSKLSNSEKFVLGISEGIRPGSTKRFGQPSQGQGVPAWASADSGFYQLAKSKGHSDQEIADLFKRRGLV